MIWHFRRKHFRAAAMVCYNGCQNLKYCSSSKIYTSTASQKSCQKMVMLNLVSNLAMLFEPIQYFTNLFKFNDN